MPIEVVLKGIGCEEVDPYDGLRLSPTRLNRRIPLLGQPCELSRVVSRGYLDGQVRFRALLEGIAGCAGPRPSIVEEATLRGPECPMDVKQRLLGRIADVTDAQVEKWESKVRTSPIAQRDSGEDGGNRTDAGLHVWRRGKCGQAGNRIMLAAHEKGDGSDQPGLCVSTSLGPGLGERWEAGIGSPTLVLIQAAVE